MTDKRLAQQRFLLLNAARGAGAVIMVIGLVLWYTDILDIGGAPLTGGLIFAAGLALSFVLPGYLARKWRTPPQQ
jgi:hypothetical protein